MVWLMRHVHDTQTTLAREGYKRRIPPRGLGRRSGGLMCYSSLHFATSNACEMALPLFDSNEAAVIQWGYRTRRKYAA